MDLGTVAIHFEEKASNVVAGIFLVAVVDDHLGDMSSEAFTCFDGLSE